MCPLKRSRYAIPDDVMIPAASRMQRELGKCVDNFIQYEVEQLREECGPEYAIVPLDDVRMQAIHLRKGSKLGSVTGHGPGKCEELSPELKAYYKTPEWYAFRETVVKFWNYRCATCYGVGMQVHHRTYERFKNELLTDCVLLCKPCHKQADTRRRREVLRNDKEPDLFS